MSKPDNISRKVKVNALSLAGGPPGMEMVNVNCVTVEGPQQFGINFVVTRDEVKKLGLSVGDLAVITIAV